MGWTCQHDYKGYCKLIKKECVPGMKGCILKAAIIRLAPAAMKKIKNYKKAKKRHKRLILPL